MLSSQLHCWIKYFPIMNLQLNETSDCSTTSTISSLSRGQVTSNMPPADRKGIRSTNDANDQKNLKRFHYLIFWYWPLIAIHTQIIPLASHPNTPFKPMLRCQNNAAVPVYSYQQISEIETYRKCWQINAKSVSVFTMLWY